MPRHIIRRDGKTQISCRGNGFLNSSTFLQRLNGLPCVVRKNGEHWLPIPAPLGQRVRQNYDAIRTVSQRRPIITNHKVPKPLPSRRCTVSDRKCRFQILSTDSSTQVLAQRPWTKSNIIDCVARAMPAELKGAMVAIQHHRTQALPLLIILGRNAPLLHDISEQRAVLERARPHPRPLQRRNSNANHQHRRNRRPDQPPRRPNAPIAPRHPMERQSYERRQQHRPGKPHQPHVLSNTKPQLQPHDVSAEEHQHRRQERAYINPDPPPPSNVRFLSLHHSPSPSLPPRSGIRQ